MNDRRRLASLCYLCGRHLPSRSTRGWKRELSGEHVVPRSLLGPPPANAADRWAVELWVHARCEARQKRERDTFIKQLQRINAEPPDTWRHSDLAAMRGKFGLLTVANGLPPVPAFKDIASAQHGVWTWVRGMHLALYNEYVDDQNPSRVLPPVPGLTLGKSVDRVKLLYQQEQDSNIIMGTVDASIVHDRWDGIDAWGRKLCYRCVWFGRGNRKTRAYMCFWALAYPGVFAWSRSVTSHIRPWHGMYARTDLPDSASVIDWRQIDAMKIPLIIE